MTERERMTKGDAGEVSGEGTQEQQMRALFAAADPCGEPSEALVRRVSNLGSCCDAAPPRAGGWWPLRKRARTAAVVSMARWGVAGLLVAALVSLWPGSRQDGGAVAAVLRASAAAPAMHVVGRGPDMSLELWYLAGVGAYLYGKNPTYETVLVDDLKHEYRYEARERRVCVTPSLMSDPNQVPVANLSAAGFLKEMLAAYGPKEIRVETVVRDGRVLRQFIGPRRITRVTIDPQTDRILLSESDVPQPDGTTEKTRYVFDYPDPATVDRSHFEFQMPKGVTIVDQTRDR